ncbi:hypothetical protein PM3016_4008 [Paenibacillus mucilaginosus 3016]|uniref:Transcription regulator PadR N-terminal domain-containing protein n=2 Tax=Paenibacillus mucilaginosus TaxID=61624 RepID=H6NI21_9BACL|nr:PadR family transcriptional regulator [Paenibacillus mucilaginosus]AFC30792.1 hypothetical protein PM3016_4008 [Paenibacillus mucilaginosus 3016]AFH63116.1 hypothetical protein B2K_20835 [Paenibacillus mucilaginosus K02]WFA19400.1 PadR family transcriptional regulator [Paenibacillus mucilaginosus]
MRFYDHRFHQGRHPGRRRPDPEHGYGEMDLRHRHGGFGGRGEGRRRFFERGEFKFALLELLATEPMHGYQLIKAMEEKTGGLYTPSAGSVYPNLQLLEDMKLIGSGESDGKKLYHITDEGRTFLQQRAEEETERAETRWEHPGRHGGRHGQHGRHGHGRGGKHELRGLMREWSEVIYLMARAAEAAQEAPSSKEAVRFQELVAGFQEGLKDLLASVPDAPADDPGSSQAAPDSPADDKPAN